MQLHNEITAMPGPLSTPTESPTAISENNRVSSQECLGKGLLWIELCLPSNS